MATTTEMAEADLYTELVTLRGLNRTMSDDLASLHAKLAGLKVRPLFDFNTDPTLLVNDLSLVFPKLEASK